VHTYGLPTPYRLATGSCRLGFQGRERRSDREEEEEEEEDLELAL